MNKNLSLTLALKRREVSSYADVIDTRDVHSRLEELESDHWDDEGESTPVDTWESTDDQEEYTALSALLAEVSAGTREQTSDGMTLVRESYFTDYIREFCADTYGGDLAQYDERKRDFKVMTWDQVMDRRPFNCVDWEMVAEMELSDYSSVVYDGVTFYYLGS